MRCRSRRSRAAAFNLPAVVLIALCALLLIRGASESAKVNAVMVVIKLAVLLLFVVVGITGWNSDNLSDFAPFGLRRHQRRRRASSSSPTSASTPCRPPARRSRTHAATCPWRSSRAGHRHVALLLVAVVAVAAQPVAEFEGQEAGLAAILEDVTGVSWPATVLAAGAVVSIFSVTLVVIYGQTRILFAMSRDGMLPRFFHQLNPRTLTPVPRDDLRRGHHRRCSPGCCRSTSSPR